MNTAGRVDVSGIGFCSNFGGYKDSCAALRANITRFSECLDFEFALEGEETGEGLTVASIPPFLSGYQGYGRLTKMVELAYRDLLKNLETQRYEPSATQLFFALPDPIDRDIESNQIDDSLPSVERLEAAFLKIANPLVRQVFPVFKDCKLNYEFGGKLAFSHTLNRALSALASNECNHCLIFAADTLLGLEHLQSNIYENNLKTPDNPVGFIPGEGAVALMISNRSLKGNSGLSIACLCNETSNAGTNKSQEEAMQRAKHDQFLMLKSCSNNFEDLPILVSDANGDEVSALDFADVQLQINRLDQNIHLPTPMVLALHYGETGVLTGALGVAYAYDNIAIRKVKTPVAILLTNKDRLEKSLIFLSTVN